MDLIVFLASHAASSFDTAVCGLQHPVTVLLSAEALGEVARILRPSSSLHIAQPVCDVEGSPLPTQSDLLSTLKLAGFVDVSKVPSTFVS